MSVKLPNLYMIINGISDVLICLKLIWFGFVSDF